MTPEPNSPRTERAIAKIRELFPDYAFFFDVDGGGFGQDVRDLLIRAVENNYTAARFRAEYKQTTYYKETTTSAKAWDAKSAGERENEINNKMADLQAEYGDLFDFEGGDKVAREVATNIAKLGLTGNRLKTFVFAETIRLQPNRGATLQTSDADKIRNTLREYGYTPSEDEINSVLTGQPDRKGMLLNQDALVERAKNAAKGTYSHLASQLDAGLSLDDIFKNYRTYAASILELDPNEIDFVKDPKWARAFGNPQTGQMTLTDWVRELKSKDEYGYQFTSQAKQTATRLVMDMEKAFGFRA